jgi:peptidoglycan/LPS O-acetylase OafA/YrhL
MFKQAAVWRGLAILLVVIDHTAVMGLSGLDRIHLQAGSDFLILLNILASFGLYAVPIFLFFSGCYMSYALEKRDIKGSYKIILATLTNVLWPYLIWSCFFYLVIYLDGGQTFTILGYLKNLIVGYPYNFVPILIFFYLISPLLKKLKGPFIFLILGLFFIYQVYLIIVLDPGIQSLFNLKIAPIFAVPILREPLRDWGIYFPMGFYIKYLLQTSDNKKRIYQITFSLLTFLVMLINLIFIAQNDPIPWIRYLVPIPFLVLCVFWEREKIPLFKIFERLGKRSYGLYLINLAIFDLLILLFNQILIAHAEFMVIYFILLFTITIILPVVAMEWIEKNIKRNVYRIVFG